MLPSFPRLLSEIRVCPIMWIYRLHYLILIKSTLPKLTNILKSIIQENHRSEIVINNTNLSKQTENRIADNSPSVKMNFVSYILRFNIIII